MLDRKWIIMIAKTKDINFYIEEKKQEREISVNIYKLSPPLSST